MLAFGLGWLRRAETGAHRKGEGFGVVILTPSADAAVEDQNVRERATIAREFDPPEVHRGGHSGELPPIVLAIAPLFVVIVVNVLMSLVVLPRLDVSFLAEERWGATSLAAVGGVWSVVSALGAAIATRYCQLAATAAVRDTMDSGANASVLPVLSVASLVGFGAVVADVPAFAIVREWVLSIEGGPLVSLAVATNLLSAITGSASGGLTIALDALGATFMRIATQQGIDPALLHRIAVMSAGTLDSLPQNGAVVTLLAVCGSTHRESYFDIVMAAIVGPIIALVVVIDRTGLRSVGRPKETKKTGGNSECPVRWGGLQCRARRFRDMGGRARSGFGGLDE